jgi:hypothetical protein
MSQSGGCLRSAAAVRQAAPGAWPSYTLQMTGHQGERCWYPTTKERRHAHVAKEVMHIGRSNAGTSNINPLTRGPGLPKLPAGAIPLPRPASEYRMITTAESERMVQWLDDILGTTARNRFDAAFETLYPAVYDDEGPQECQIAAPPPDSSSTWKSRFPYSAAPCALALNPPGSWSKISQL